MCPLYEYFSRDWKHILDYSEESMLELFLSESYGDVTCKSNNGFYVGKKQLNLTVSMWKEDLDKGLLFKSELYADPNLPDHWLDKVLKKL